jgi:hypothetical protein
VGWKGGGGCWRGTDMWGRVLERGDTGLRGGTCGWTRGERGRGQRGAKEPGDGVGTAEEIVEARQVGRRRSRGRRSQERQDSWDRWRDWEKEGTEERRRRRQEEKGRSKDGKRSNEQHREQMSSD